MSSKPWSFSSRTMCSIIGRLANGIIGLGRFEVSGRRRVPSPPAMITAFILLPSSCCLRARVDGGSCSYPALSQRISRQRHVGERRPVAEHQPRDGEAPCQEAGHVL